MLAERQTPSQSEQSSNIRLVSEFYKSVFMDRNTDICSHVIIEDYVNHSSFVENGRENFKSYFEQYYKTFSKSGSEIVHIFEEGDRVCVYANHWASNRLFKVKFKAIDIYKVKDGHLVEHWDSVEGLNGFSRFIFVVKAVLKL